MMLVSRCMQKLPVTELRSERVVSKSRIAGKWNLDGRKSMLWREGEVYIF